MGPCASYQPWHNKQTGKTYLKQDDGKCLHYYFYFIDEELGLTYVRAHLVAVPFADLLQRAQLAGSATGEAEHSV